MRQEDSVLRDLEYLHQISPKQAKKLQKRIAEILDKMDYEGCILYDEYPDKLQLYRLGGNIVTILRREEEESDMQKHTTPEEWEWIGDMVQILLHCEIYKRRHGGRRGFLKF